MNIATKNLAIYAEPKQTEPKQTEPKQTEPKQTEPKQAPKPRIAYSRTSGGWSLRKNPRKSPRNDVRSSPIKTTASANTLSSPAQRSVQPWTQTAIPAAKWIESQWLSADQVDSFAEQGTDWISILPQHWNLHLETIALPGIQTQKRAAWQPALCVHNLVTLTQQSDYAAVAFPNTTYWSYTACLYLPTLGRVRLIVCFQSSAQREDPIVLVTNRLDWSPRKVISQCVLLGGWPCCFNSNT